MAPVLNLNNEVVKMRKDVKKVKVLTIRKLTRNISKLKSKKGTEELIQKNQRRAQRLLEEIHTIKKLRPDDITKTALQKEINFEKVCKKPNITVETRAIARLATHPLLKQKISTIKDAIKAFKEARKMAAEQEAETEEICKPDESAKITKTDTAKSKQTQKTEGTKAGDESLDNSLCKPLLKETDLDANDRRHEENTIGSQNGQISTLLSVPKVSVERKLREGVPKKPTSLSVPKVSTKKKLEGVREKPISVTVPEVSTEKKLVDDVLEKPVSLAVPEVSAETKPVVDVSEKQVSLAVPKVSAERKHVVDVSEKPVSLAVPKVSEERKPVVDVSEKQGLENKVENKSRLGKKTPASESASDSSDIEDSDKEDQEYFDDSTEERFYKQSSGFEDSDSDSENDFFLGKVRQTKKKKSSKNPSKDKVEKEKPPKEAIKPSAGSTEAQKGNIAPKTLKLNSVFCSSLSNTKQKSTFIKRETKPPLVRNIKAVVPQAPKWVKKPQAARNHAVKSQSKPEPALHPSWEASRKRKEQSQIAVFQGKKIVFGD